MKRQPASETVDQVKLTQQKKYSNGSQHRLLSFAQTTSSGEEITGLILRVQATSPRQVVCSRRSLATAVKTVGCWLHNIGNQQTNRQEAGVLPGLLPYWTGGQSGWRTERMEDTKGHASQQAY